MIRDFFLYFILFITNCMGYELTLNDVSTERPTYFISPQDELIRFELDRREYMLKTHRVMGLATLGFLSATVLTGENALNGDLHRKLGITSSLLYITTAYYGITAPNPIHSPDSVYKKWHKRLAWIHFPALLVSPILGYQFKKNKEEGRKSSQLIKNHATVAGLGYVAFALSAALMTFDF